LGYSLAEGPADKPAKVPAPKLPGGAVKFLIRWTIFDRPADYGPAVGISMPGIKKEDLPFNTARDFSPALLVAVYGFDGQAEQSGHIPLRLPDFLSKTCEFPGGHDSWFVAPFEEDSNFFQVREQCSVGCGRGLTPPLHSPFFLHSNVQQKSLKSFKKMLAIYATP